MTETLANLVLGFAWVGALVFVVAYHFKTGGAWRDTALGRNVMAMMAAIVALLALAILRTFIPWLADHLQALRLAAFLVVAYIVWRRVVLLFRYQARRGDASPEPLGGVRPRRRP